MLIELIVSCLIIIKDSQSADKNTESCSCIFTESCRAFSFILGLGVMKIGHQVGETEKSIADI
jgi:hypothetical protein